MATSPNPEYVLTYNEYAGGTVHLISCRQLTRAKRLVAWPQARGMTREGIRMLMNAGWSELFPTVDEFHTHFPVDDCNYDWDYWEGYSSPIYPTSICKHCLPDQYSVKAHLR